MAYSPSLKALFARNTRLVPTGEVGDNNDADPICQCQDWGAIRLTRIKIHPVSPDAVRATVSLDSVVDHHHDRLAEVLVLVRTRLGWRVDDVIPSGRGTGLKASLAAENRRLARGR